MLDDFSFGEFTIKLDCDVLVADGGTRTAAITGASVAIVDAFRWMVANGKLTSTLTYNASGNLYWTQVDAGNLGVGAGAQSAFGASGRANLNWQVRPDDLVQFNLIAFGKRLGAQGFNTPSYTVNLGWRHKVNDKVTATLTLQDLFASNRFERRLDTPIVFERLVGLPVSRAVFLRLDYRFGGRGKAGREPGFEYDQPGAGPPAGPGPG